MKTTNDPDSVLGQGTRLPVEPAAGGEGWAHGVLGGAAVAMVWLMLASIQDFVPRAGTFAERLRETPAMLVDPAYAVHSTITNRGAATVANTAGRR
ncbi:MAG: hypothetical protein M5U12_37225 [Verrucomicrobia bacterium]|nr:hypothetical protein [Verrucomicrobiota bacterium]